jgi:hypothetical protein
LRNDGVGCSVEQVESDRWDFVNDEIMFSNKDRVDKTMRRTAVQ